MNEKFEEIHLWTVYIIQLVITLIKLTKSDWYIKLTKVSVLLLSHDRKDKKNIFFTYIYFKTILKVY